MWLLAFAFAAGWTISAAMAAHLPRLLESAGASPAQALQAGILVGPAKVAARLADALLLRRFHPLLSARVAAVLYPLGAGLLAFGAGAVPAFALLRGAGNGILTIARGSVPLALYGPVNYGCRLGILGAPSRMRRPRLLYCSAFSSTRSVLVRSSFRPHLGSPRLQLFA